MCLAYTSFAVRMLQGRDILKSTAAALPADALLDLCVTFGARGAQLDWSQIESHEPAALAAFKARVERDRLGLELSGPASCLETPEALTPRWSRPHGARRHARSHRAAVRRRYETFKTRDEWNGVAAKWVAHAAQHKARHRGAPVVVGIENHKDSHAAELAELLRSSTARRSACCVDFGNNLSLLEEPMETFETLAPFAVTTHLKDMAVKPTADGFELSEVPLGEGILPLQR